jgi:hypothetical protein
MTSETRQPFFDHAPTVTGVTSWSLPRQPQLTHRDRVGDATRG